MAPVKRSPNSRANWGMAAAHLGVARFQEAVKFMMASTTVQIEMWYGNGGTERPRSPLGAIWNGVKNNGEKGAEVVRT